MIIMYMEKVFYVLYITHVIFSTIHSVQGYTCTTSEADAVRLRSRTWTTVLEYSANARDRYGNYRYSNSVCYWLIESSGTCESSVNLQVESTTGGQLKIFDGQSTDNRILWRSGMRRSITSASPYVVVQFATSPSRHQRHQRFTFKIIYKTVKKESAAAVRTSPGPINSINDACYDRPIMLLATYDPNYIQSPGSGSYYGNSLRCTWLIVSDCYAVIKITFKDLFTENGYDFVRVYDGRTVSSKLLGAFSGNEVPNPVISTAHEVLVTFITDKENTFRGFKLRYEKDLTFPVILSDVKRIYKDSNIFLTVDVTSISPIRSFQWLKNGKLLYDDANVVNTETDNCTTSDNETPIQSTSTLSLTSITAQTYGTYKVSVQNDAGFSERLIQLNKPSTVTFGFYNVSLTSDNITIQVPVTLESTYNGTNWFTEEVNWFTENSRIDDDGHKYKISVSQDSNMKHHIFQLEVFFPDVDDYIQYKLSVTSEDRTAEIIIPVQVPEEFIPTINNYSTNIELNAKISVSYQSSLSPNSIQWEKDSTVLADSNKYGISSGTNTGIIALDIYSVNEADFGSYKLSITNAAGTRTSYFNLDKPEVFPVIMTCNQSKKIVITCTIVNCKESFLPWIHSIDGTTVRHITGHVKDQTSTLTISQCTGEDIGRYTCVTEQELQNGTKISVSKASSLLSVYASPIIDNTVNIVIEHNRIQLRVNVTSNPAIRLLKWFRNEALITDGASIRKQPVKIAIRGSVVTTLGYVVELLVPNYNDHSFGIYKVYVANDMGVSEHYIHVDNPDEGIHVIANKTSFVTNSDGIDVSVVFLAFPKYTSVSWTNTETGTTLDKSPRHNITTEATARRSREYVTKMYITDIRASDYTKYKVSIKNKVGHSEYFVTLKNPKEGVPVFQDDVLTTIDGSMAVIAVNFTSHPVIHSVTWFKDDTPLLSGLKYNSTTQEQSLRIASTGSVEIVEGYQNQLTIADINQSDFGHYRVQLQNGRGYTQKVVALTADCDIKSTS